MRFTIFLLLLTAFAKESGKKNHRKDCKGKKPQQKERVPEIIAPKEEEVKGVWKTVKDGKQVVRWQTFPAYKLKDPSNPRYLKDVMGVVYPKRNAYIDINSNWLTDFAPSLLKKPTAVMEFWQDDGYLPGDEAKTNARNYPIVLYNSFADKDVKSNYRYYNLKFNFNRPPVWTVPPHQTDINYVKLEHYKNGKPTVIGKFSDFYFGTGYQSGLQKMTFQAGTKKYEITNHNGPQYRRRYEVRLDGKHIATMKVWQSIMFGGLFGGKGIWNEHVPGQDRFHLAAIYRTCKILGEYNAPGIYVNEFYTA